MLKNKILLGVFFAVLITVACQVPAWVNTVENIAETGVTIAAELVAVADPSIAPLVTEADNLLNALIATLNTYKASPNATNLQSVQSAVDAVQANEAKLEAAVNATPSQDATINAILALLAQVTAQIIADVPVTTTSAKLKATAPGLKADDFKAKFNAIVANDHRFHPIR